MRIFYCKNVDVFKMFLSRFSSSYIGRNDSKTCHRLNPFHEQCIFFCLFLCLSLLGSVCSISILCLELVCSICAPCLGSESNICTYGNLIKYITKSIKIKLIIYIFVHLLKKSLFIFEEVLNLVLCEKIAVFICIFYVSILN